MLLAEFPAFAARNAGSLAWVGARATVVHLDLALQVGFRTRPTKRVKFRRLRDS